ncbi:MAG: hypothetical protein ABIH20_05050 [Candidatus Diapherotrites archaeon]
MARKGRPAKKAVAKAKLGAGQAKSSYTYSEPQLFVIERFIKEHPELPSQLVHRGERSAVYFDKVVRLFHAHVALELVGKSEYARSIYEKNLAVRQKGFSEEQLTLMALQPIMKTQEFQRKIREKLGKLSEDYRKRDSQ